MANKENTTNRVEEVKATITDLIEKKAGELDKITAELEAARDRKRKAETALHSAIETTDAAAYKKAKAEADEAATLIEMYTARYGQLRNKEFMSEEESDRVIDSLIEYQNDRAAAFVEAIKGPLAQLEAIYKEYAQDYEDAVKTVNAWTANIHANYRTPRTTYADGSHRSNRPAPVTGATGFFPLFNDDAARVEDFLKLMKK